MPDRSAPPSPPAAPPAAQRLFAVALVTFACALAVRLSVLTFVAPDLRFGKYIGAALRLLEGRLEPERLGDFSPLTLQWYRLLLVLGGEGSWLVLASQCVLGALMAAVASLLAARVGGVLAAAVAGACVAFSHDLVIYDQIDEPEPLLLLLSTTAVLCAWRGADAHAATRTRVALSGVSGLLFGLAIATRPTAVLLLPVLPLLQLRRPSRGAALVAFVLGLAATAAPFLLGTSSDAKHSTMSPLQVLYTGNNPLATGLWRDDFLVKDLERESEGETPDYAHETFRQVALASGARSDNVDRYWGELSMAYARSHPERLLSLAAWKLLALGQRHVPHDLGPAARLDRRLAGLPLGSTTLLLPIGVLGLLFSLRTTWPLVLPIAAQLLTCLVFLVSARHRLFLLPWVSVGVGLLAAQLWQHVRARGDGDTSRPRKLALQLGSCAALVMVFAAPLPPGYERLRARELEGDCWLRHERALGLFRQSRLQSAGEELAACVSQSPWLADVVALIRVPLDVRGIATSALARNDFASDAFGARREGLLAELAGDHGRAARSYERVLARAGISAPELAYAAAVRLGVVLAAQDQDDRARAAFARARKMRPGSAPALAGLSLTSDPSARPALLREADALSPKLEVRYHLGRMALQMQRPELAVPPLDELSRALPEYGRGRMLLSVALHRTGQLELAEKHALRAQARLGRHRDAELDPRALLREVAERNGGDPARFRNLAQIAEIYGDLPLATLAWQRLAELRPLSAHEHAELGMLYLLHERTASARTELERALALDPTLELARRGLSSLPAR